MRNEAWWRMAASHGCYSVAASSSARRLHDTPYSLAWGARATAGRRSVRCSDDCSPRPQSGHRPAPQ
eukprot:15461498-Alexandrium_andersonii.AAC.1